MKRSRNVVLVLSGAIAVGSLTTGCDQRPEVPSVSSEETYTNNQYHAGGGYYHAPNHAWYPYPYNYYEPARGYYRGGTWWPQSAPALVSSSKPIPSEAARVNTSSFGSRVGSSSSSGSSSGSKSGSSFSRGGFGSSGSHSSGFGG